MLSIYECHVKGLTKLHPRIPQDIRGTFRGLAHPVMIQHILSLGMNAVQLMPVFEKKSSYWGYDTTNWFKLNPELGTLNDFIYMCKELQANGLKVILDVVYNHLGTNEPDMEGVYFAEIDRTGCGNCIDVEKSLPTIMKSIDFWMEHVDGMRFDLAGVMGREGNRGFNPRAKFFRHMLKHTLRNKILIAEPYDLHEQSYGRYPEGWLELNHHFRDHVRKGGVYKWSRPNDVNYICCHDGFCMNDLIAYSRKYNHANGEDNRDGNDDNNSWNFGVEGNTTDEDVIHRRNIHKGWLTKQLLSCNTNIMFLAGDETTTNTQFGNNNAWNQDNPLGWVIWE